MKSIFTLCLSLLMIYYAYGQNADSVITEKPGTGNFSPSASFDGANGNQKSTFLHQTPKQARLMIKGNLTFTTYSFQMSPIETEISDLEALECKALLKRDTSTLRTLWARDFTLDEPVNELVDGKNPLPYYISFSRMVEKFNAMDNVVYTSGYEVLQRLKTDGSIEERVKRDYFHTWIRKYGVWKLSTKTHN